jgi:GNAT superfamily N-acetyltransferase
VAEPVVRLLGDDDDVDQLGRLIRAAYLSLPGYPKDDEYEAHLADIEGRRRDTVVIVAELDGRLVGCLTYVAGIVNGHVDHGDPDAATFRYFGVDPAAQGRGVGDAMVRWVIDRTRADGKRRILIHTLDVMRGAQRLYERLGFVRDEARDEDWDGLVGIAYRYDV